MSKEMLDSLLAGKLRDPDGGGMSVPPLKDIVIARGLADAAASLVAPLSFGKSLAVVMDPDTRAAMGEKVAGSLASAYTVEEIVLTRDPHPDMDAVNGVTERTRKANALIAVGSGSVNDITKYAAHLTGKPYAVFGTSPSMNGYTSVSAAITDKGLKKSLPATLPKGVFLDLEVMAAAPQAPDRLGLRRFARPRHRADRLADGPSPARQAVSRDAVHAACRRRGCHDRRRPCPEGGRHRGHRTAGAHACHVGSAA